MLTASQHFLAFAVDSATWELFLDPQQLAPAILSSSPSSTIAAAMEVGLPAYLF